MPMVMLLQAEKMVMKLDVTQPKGLNKEETNDAGDGLAKIARGR